jgi:hypothetical protein
MPTILLVREFLQVKETDNLSSSEQVRLRRESSSFSAFSSQPPSSPVMPSFVICESVKASAFWCLDHMRIELILAYMPLYHPCEEHEPSDKSSPGPSTEHRPIPFGKVSCNSCKALNSAGCYVLSVLQRCRCSPHCGLTVWARCSPHGGLTVVD